MMILALALLVMGLQPWSHAYSANQPTVGGIAHAIAGSADHDDGDRDAGIAGEGHCIFHAGCAAFSPAEPSRVPVSYPSDWPVFNAGADLGRRLGPDPKPPKLLG